MTNNGQFKKGHKVNLGKKNRLGKYCSKETKEKMSQSHKGMKHKAMSKEGRMNIGKARKGKKWGHHTKEARMKISKANKGSKGNNWKGGITLKHKEIRQSIEYRLWREAVFARDNWTCQKCKVRSGNGKAIILHPHHIKNFAQYPELRFAIDNGTTFCIKCHKRFHKKYGTKNNIKEQLKEYLWNQKTKKQD